MTNPPPSFLTPDDPNFDIEDGGDWYAELDNIYKIVLDAQKHLDGQLDPVAGTLTLASRAHHAALQLLQDEPPQQGDYEALVGIRDEVEVGLGVQRAGLGGGAQILDDLNYRLGRIPKLDPQITH